MRAMIVNDWCEPRDMQLVELPDPEPGPGQVCIDVRASACNFFDILMAQGKYQVRPPLPFSPGGEVAGVVRAVGAGVDNVKPGDRVFAMLGWGGYASVALAPAVAVVRMPDAMTFEHGAAFGVVYQTSYFGLVYRANLQPGETLLVHAGAGGVGLAAVQIGRALGARVLATASSPAKLAVAKAHGAEEAYDYSTPEWVERVKAATGSRGADVIYDPVGGDVFDLSTKCIAFGGRLLVIGFASGRIPSIQANRILLKNISIVGLHWGAYRQHDPARIPQAMDALFELYARGAVTPVISSSRPLAEAAAALDEIASRRSTGKVLLIP
ncbi:MAG: NADPH:quinone oxidoreductase family protein [Deltaproteobacteria bacterium]|nr:NADPH:quinone oxidoreductase family protein [Deltaproteobacteria bacterium]MBI3389274.1 NADPH:quinone oxidoreductase family protein [Deltaproteobacteria bacterium]